MYKVPTENMKVLLESMSQYGGNVPLAHGSYLGEARTLRIYPRGTKVVTPYGVQELVVGADVEIIRKLNYSLERYGITGGQTQEEQERLFREANQSGVPEVVPFYLTPDGKIHYKTFAVSYMQVPQDQIPEAEGVLRNVKVVGYKDSPFITAVIGEDGSMISDVMLLGRSGGELRLLDEPQPDYSAGPINPEPPVQPTELYNIPEQATRTVERTPSLIQRLFRLRNNFNSHFLSISHSS